MKCEDVHRELGPYLDSELSADLSFEIGEHIQNCRACSERLYSEKKIEKYLQSLIRKESAEDRRIWDNALEKATGIGPKSRKLRMGYMAVAASLILAVGFGVWFVALQHHEMDLARSVAKIYLDYLVNEQLPAMETRNIHELENFFSDRVDFPSGFARDLPEGYLLTGGKTCFLDGVLATFWMIRKDTKVLSLFSFARKQLTAFPEAAALADSKAGRFHCQVGNLEFFTLVEEQRVISGIGDINADELEKLILYMAGQ